MTDLRETVLGIVAGLQHRDNAAQADAATDAIMSEIAKAREDESRFMDAVEIVSEAAEDWATGKTERGFPEHTFKDHYGKDVCLQESSLATEPCIWIFPEVVMVDGTPICGAHLTPQMARDVAWRLVAWANAEDQGEAND